MVEQWRVDIGAYLVEQALWRVAVGGIGSAENGLGLLEQYVGVAEYGHVVALVAVVLGKLVGVGVELYRPVALTPSVGSGAGVELCLSAIFQRYGLGELQLRALVHIRCRGLLACYRVVDEHFAHKHALVALIALEGEKVAELRVHGADAGARLFHQAVVIARWRALVYLPERAEASVEHALCGDAIVGHGVDEVFYLRPIVVEELLAIVVGEVEEAAVDDVVAIHHSVVELGVGRGVRVIVGHVATGVHRPVHVQLHQERFSHPLVWLAVGGGVAGGGEVWQALL